MAVAKPGFLFLEFMVALVIFVIFVGVLGGLLSTSLTASARRFGRLVACSQAMVRLERARIGLWLPGAPEDVTFAGGRRFTIQGRPVDALEVDGRVVAAPGAGVRVTVTWQSMDRRLAFFDLVG